jgi:hypothetical protein
LREVATDGFHRFITILRSLVEMAERDHDNQCMSIPPATCRDHYKINVIGALGRYTHRVGISNSRVASSNPDGVTFATKHGRSCTLPQVEFLRRLLLHVLPKGFHKIRHYGLCSASHVRLGTLEQAQTLLLAKQPQSLDASRAVTPQTWVECMLALTGLDIMHCPRCENGRLIAQPLAEPGSPTLRDTS